MSSFPCKSPNRPGKCPPLSDSEDDLDDQTSNEVIDTPEAGNVELDEYGNVIPRPPCFVDLKPSTGTRTESIEKLQKNAEELKGQVDGINAEVERMKNEIFLKKQCWLDAVLKVVEFEESIQQIEASVADKLHHFQSRLIDLESKRMEIYQNSGDENVRDVLENEIDDVREGFELQESSDETELYEMTQQGQRFAASLGNVIEDYQKYFQDTLNESCDASPTCINEMKQKFDRNLMLLINLVFRPVKFCSDPNGDRFYLNSQKEKVYKIENYSSEYKLNVDGNREKVKDGFRLENDERSGEFYVDLRGHKIYSKIYFEDENGRFYLDIHGNRRYKADPEASEYMLVNGKWMKIKSGTYETDETGMRVRQALEVAKGEDENEDDNVDVDGGSTKSSGVNLHKKICNDDEVNYIKEVVGPAIRKGLAAVTLHKPADPINYFANFLLHYRYNQHMFEKRDMELKHFLELRKQMKEKNDCESS